MTARAALRIRVQAAFTSAVLVVGSANGLPAGGASSFVGYRTWTISSPSGDVVVSQFLMPVIGHVQLRPNLDLTITDAGASSRTESGGQETTLSGLSSLSARAFLRLADDRVLLQTGVTAPSGKRSIAAEDAGVLQLIGLPLLRFGLRHYGRGPELNLGATLAFPWSPTVAGSIGAGFTGRGEYALFENSDDYRPASEWAVNGGIDWGDRDPEAQGAFVRANATARFFGPDQLDGRDAFREGDQFELGLHGLTRGPKLQWSGSMRAVFKADNVHYGTPGTVLSQIEVASGNGVFASGGGSIPVGSSWRAGLDLEWNRVSGSDEFGRNGNSYALGPALERQSERLGVRVRAMYLGGTLEGATGGDNSDLSGFSAELSVHSGWGP